MDVDKLTKQPNDPSSPTGGPNVTPSKEGTSASSVQRMVRPFGRVFQFLLSVLSWCFQSVLSNQKAAMTPSERYFYATRHPFRHTVGGTRLWEEE